MISKHEELEPNNPSPLLSRRTILKRSAILSLSLPVFGGLLAACGGDDDDDDDTGSAATEEAATEEAATEEADDSDDADDAEETETEAAAEETEASDDTGDDEDDAGEESSGEPKTLIYAGGVNTDTLDGIFNTTVITDTLIMLIHHALVNFGIDLSIEPDLAESWEVADDGVTWTFNLAPDAKFSNGNPADANAVKFTFDRILDESVGAITRGAFLVITSVDVVDEQTVNLVTAEPFPDFLALIQGSTPVIVDPSEVEKYDDPRDYGLHVVGSGQFMIESWDSGGDLVLVKNPHYHGDPPGVDKIIYKTVPEPGTRMAMLRSGEVNFVPAPVPEEVDELLEDDNFNVEIFPSYKVGIYEILLDKPPLDKPEVRKALNYAIDKQAIIDELLDGRATQYCAPTSPTIGPDYYVKQECYDYDPEKAKELLAEAGYPDGFDMEFWTSTGRYVKDTEIAAAVQAYLSAVGINAQYTAHEWATYTQMWSQPDRTMWFISRSSAPGNPDEYFTRQFTKEYWDSGSNNNYRFSDPRVEELVQEARYMMDTEKRAEIYAEVQQIIWDYCPAVYLHAADVVTITTKNISGVVVLPTENIDLRHVKMA